MKLLTEPEEHHLPDSHQAMQPWHTRLLKRAFHWLLSETGLTVAIGLLLVLALTALVVRNYLGTARGVDHNGISLMDFYADSRLEIPDLQATQRKIDRTKQTIPPIYQDPALHNQDIAENLKNLLSDFGALATNTGMVESEKYARFQQLAGNHLNSDAVFERFLTRPIPAEDWVEVSRITQTVMQGILKSGFTEADEQLKRDFVLRQNMAQGHVGAHYRELVYFLLDASLEPNLILDEPAMKRKQEEVAAQIGDRPEIRVFSKGQKIAAKGQKISAVELAALDKMGKASARNLWMAALGILLISTLFVFTLWSGLYNFRERQFFKPAYAALLSSLIVMTVLFFHLQDIGLFRESADAWVFAFPMGAIALSIAIFMHPQLSILTTTLTVFFMALTLRGEFQSMAVLLFGSYMGVYILSKRITYSDRGQLIYAGFYVGATNLLILLAVNLLKPGFAGWASINGELGVKLACSFVSGVFSGILTIGSLPLLESVFRLITPYTLTELGNHDQPLLKRMQFEAPGTFHHSLMVATLAEAAAEAVGANALLTRVGCLYHDIGKMKRPLFFIENQAYFGVENPHDKLTPRLSKMVITAHPRDSLEMARQHKLPEVLMKFMTEHHGTLTAGYFYNKACIEEGVDNVNKSQFRYPGPKPGSKETAIVMLADASESAVRALKNPTVAQVEERIDKIIQQRIEDGQFDNCPITFQDMYQIKKTFVRVLRGIQHNRIEYQQHMMRELGRKLPPVTIQDHAQEHAGLQDALRHSLGKVSPETGEHSAHDGC